MNKIIKKSLGLMLGLLTVFLLLGPNPVGAMIDGVMVNTGDTISLTAKAGHISTGDGNSVYMWGYALDAPLGNGSMQHPGPTIILNQGDLVLITLNNELSVPVSLVFPGQEWVMEIEGVPGLLALEAYPGGTASYLFLADKPGTFIYYSGSQPELQVEMGLVGAIIVRPTGYMEADPNTYMAYNHPDSQYRREVLMLITELDPTIHAMAEAGKWDKIDNTKYLAVYWLINGRTAPDTMDEAYVPWLPTQPYNCMPMMHPGEKTLLRLIVAGRNKHPLHTHGNHSLQIARDGQMLESSPGVSGPDLATLGFTYSSAPGSTMDLIYQWTGKDLGWDAYGHNGTEQGICAQTDANGFDVNTYEYCPDHGKPFPVNLPNTRDLTPGMWYSGSPYLGSLGILPPGEGGFNPNAGFFFMMHSHAEVEITNNNIFPGGMLTMGVVLPPSVPIMP